MHLRIPLLAVVHAGTAENEMWCMGDSLIAFQFHPELTGALTLEKIWPALWPSGRLGGEEHVRESEAALQAHDPAAHACAHDFFCMLRAFVHRSGNGLAWT